MLDRFQRRFDYRPDDTMTALLHDQGRAAVEAISNAQTLDGPGLMAGLERIKKMPATRGGGLRTYIGYGPEDHRGYRGDFMFMKRLRGGKFSLRSLPLAGVAHQPPHLSTRTNSDAPPPRDRGNPRSTEATENA